MVMGDPSYSIRPISGDLNDFIVERLKHGPSGWGIAAANHPGVAAAGHGKMIILGVVGPQISRQDEGHGIGRRQISYAQPTVITGTPNNPVSHGAMAKGQCR